MRGISRRIPENLHYLVKTRGGAEESVKASSTEACHAATRAFGSVSFLFKQREDILKMLGDPEPINDYNKKAKSGLNEPLVYVFS